MLHTDLTVRGDKRVIAWLTVLGTMVLGPWIGSARAALPDAPQPSERSHLASKVFRTCEAAENLELKDFCLTRDGQVLTLVGPAGPRARINPKAGEIVGTEVRLFNAEGEAVKQWKVDFGAEAVNIAPDGSVFLGGAGKVAKYQLDGTQLAIGDAPQMSKLLADPELLKQQAQEMIESERAAREERIKLLEQQIEEQKALEKKQAESGEAKPVDAAKPAEVQKPAAIRPAFKAAPRLKVLPAAPGADKSSAVDPPGTLETAPAEAVRTATAQVQAAAEEARQVVAEQAAAARQAAIEKATAARLKAVQRVAAVKKEAAPAATEQKTGEPPAVKPATLPAVRPNVRILLSTPGTRTRNAATMRRQLEIMKQQGDRDIEAVTAQILAGLNTVNAISASDKHLFIASREAKGFGYAVWRTDLDFKNPKQIVSGLSGCCGQMDVQVAGENEIYVAENSRHRVVRYNADGKKLGMFGKRDREGIGEGFGGCCNPMNLCFGSDGAVLVAESNGTVKHFTPQGEFVALVGAADVPEGCKNSAIAVTSDGSQVFYIDVKNAKIHVLVKRKGDSPKAG